MAKEPKKIKKVKGTAVVKKVKATKLVKKVKADVAELNAGDSMTGVISGLVAKPVVTDGYALKGQNYDNVAPQDLAEFAQSALREYGSYVVEDRAVADFRDGLKPSHRAIIWSMCDLGLRSNAGHKKAARTVGQGIGMYHPHGDTSLYGAMVTIANTIPPAVDGQGNWGTPTDGAAAMRYTESKLSIFATMFLVDRKYLDVVPMVANYSNDGKIPLYMPALLPYLLFNGSVPAPAYGVKAGNPTFSFESVANTVIHALEGKEVDSKYLQKNLKIEHEYGCDNITSPEEFKTLVETGRGRVTYRGRVSVDVKSRIIVIHTFVPAGFASSATINKTLEKLSLISGVSKAYSNCGLKNKDAGAWGAAYEVKCGRVSEDRLYEIAREVEKHVTNSVSYSLGVTIRKETDANAFQYLDYVKYFKAWVSYRLKLEVRLNKDLKEKAEREKHILEVYLFAVDNIKKLLAALPKVLAAADPDKMLAKMLKMDEADAKIILDRQVRKLAKLERADLVKAIDKLKADIKQYSANIKDPGTAAAVDTKARVSAYLKNLDKHPYNAKEKIFCYRPENKLKTKTKRKSKK